MKGDADENRGLTTTHGQSSAIVYHLDDYLEDRSVECSSESIFLQSWLSVKCLQAI